jgi:hypothetical protein
MQNQSPTGLRHSSRGSGDAAHTSMIGSVAVSPYGLSHRPERHRPAPVPASASLPRSLYLPLPLPFHPTPLVSDESGAFSTSQGSPAICSDEICKKNVEANRDDGLCYLLIGTRPFCGCFPSVTDQLPQLSLPKLNSFWPLLCYAVSHELVQHLKCHLKSLRAKQKTAKDS